MENKENDAELEDLGESSGNEEMDLVELAPLRALSSALKRRIRVSTSRVKLDESDPNSTEFVGVEGFVDRQTLKCLEESVSDIISRSEDGHSIQSSQSKTSGPQTEATNPNDLAAMVKGSSSKTNDSFYSIPSCTSSFDGIVDSDALKNAEDVIADLEKNGPAGLVHLSSLSAAIGKPIRVWTSGSLDSKKVGRTKTGEAVEIEYHEPDAGQVEGHWTLRGNREPGDVQGQLNDCLFNVVADQTNRLGPDLRAETTARMRKNVKSLANRIDKIAELEKCDRISLLVGGAAYSGNRPQDAGRVIGNSQKGRCHPSGMHGHPRGHASHPEATGPTESVENYSMTGLKSAFLSREDQDAVGHLALETSQARAAMDNLNSGAQSIAIHVRPGELRPGPLPNAVEYYQGHRQGGERPIKELVLVLRHHQEQQRNPSADVFVHTFYPVVMK